MIHAAPRACSRRACHLTFALRIEPHDAGTRRWSRALSTWATFRRQLREQLSPLPDPPGVRNPSLVDPEGWERMSKADVRAALKLAAIRGVGDWVWLFRALRRVVLGDGGGGNEAAAEGGGASSQPPQPPRAGTLAAGGAPAAPPLLSAEDARAAALALAGGVAKLSRDELLRQRLRALGAEGMTVTREALDEFLLGYQVHANRRPLPRPRPPRPLTAAAPPPHFCRRRGKTTKSATLFGSKPRQRSSCWGRRAQRRGRRRTRRRRRRPAKQRPKAPVFYPPTPFPRRFFSQQPAL
jgi:hypothetical protein